jgi:drug/metabolite transporter (DMT)-like permease
MHSIELRRGALFAVGAAFLFATMGACIKLLAGLPTEMVVFFRNAIALLALLPWLANAGVPGLKTQRLRLHLLRTAAGLTAMYCFFFVLARMPLAEAVLLNFSAPLFIPPIARLWLGERATVPVYLAVGVGFVGVALILKPGLDLFQPVGLIGLVSGMFVAVAVSTVRRLSSTEPPLRIVFYFTVLSSLVSALPLLWSWQTPSASQGAILIAVGLFAVGGQWLLTRAYCSAPAAQVGPFSYAGVVFAGVYGLALWQEMLDAPSLAGAVLVVLAGALAMQRYSAPTIAADVGATAGTEPSDTGPAAGR